MVSMTGAAVAAGGVFIGIGLWWAWRGARAPVGLWRLPAALSAGFLVWTLYAVVTEGPLGFWAEHTRNGWGVQIWIDLLLAATVAWLLAGPRMRAVGMAQPLWFFAIAATGSIGLTALLARLLYLEERGGRTST